MFAASDDHIVRQDACKQALLCVASGPNSHRRGVVRGCSWREVAGVHRCTMVSVCVNRHELESNMLGKCAFARARTCEDEVGFFIDIVLFRLCFLLVSSVALLIAVFKGVELICVADICLRGGIISVQRKPPHQYRFQSMLDG
jgi:hypothetical protein